jgi:2-dehydro-3-deoxyphosphooctonate aldolase (KDO 8-P synthase)
MQNKTVVVKNVKINNTYPTTLIAGICVIESARQAFEAAGLLKSIAKKFGISFIFKVSYDKANRSSIKSYRGPGLKDGLKILENIKKEYKIPILTDVHCVADVEEVAKLADVIQVPAFLSRQTDLVVACAKTGKTVNVKKAQFMAPKDIENVIEKIESTGNKNILLTERGTSFGYRNLVVDMRSLEIMKQTGYPVIFDATHSVQLPGGVGNATGGEREFVETLSKAAAAVGVAGFFFETHKNPNKALSDEASSLSFAGLEEILKKIKAIDTLVKKKY